MRPAAGDSFFPLGPRHGTCLESLNENPLNRCIVVTRTADFKFEAGRSMLWIV